MLIEHNLFFNVFLYLEPDDVFLVNSIYSHWSKYIPSCTEYEFYVYSISSNNLKRIKWSHEQKYPIGSSGLDIAVEFSHITIIKWLYKHYVFSPMQIAIASGSGRYNVVKWLVSNQSPMDESALAYACFNGHEKIARFLYRKGCPYDHRCTKYAAYRENLYLLMWLHEKKFPINKTKCMEYVIDRSIEYLIKIQNGEYDCKSDVFLCKDVTCKCKYKEYREFFRWTDTNF